MFTPRGETIRLLVVGKTGVGKSTTGNTILRGDFFHAEASFKSVTSKCELKRNIRDGVTIEIMDSPGLMDTHQSYEAIGTHIAQAVGAMHPGPHAILLVISITRFTEEEENAFKNLMALFDENLAKYTIVVFTRGDEIGKRKTIKGMINESEELKTIVHTCGNRYIVFNNKADNKEPQVDDLLQKVRVLMNENGGVPYTSPKYFMVGKVMEMEVKTRMENAEKEMLRKKRYVLTLEADKLKAEADVAREREELKKRELEIKKQEQKSRDFFELEKQKFEQQQMNEKIKRQETEFVLQQFWEERQQEIKKMEEDKKQQQEKLRQKDMKIQEILKNAEELKKQLGEKKRTHKEQMEKLREGIANKGNSPLLDMLAFVVIWILRAFRIL